MRTDLCKSPKLYSAPKLAQACLRAFLLVLTTALMSAAIPAWASDDHKIFLTNQNTNKQFGELEIGFGGHVLGDIPSPITIRLNNPFDDQRQFSIEFHTEGNYYNRSRQLKRTVLLDAKAKKVLRLNMLIAQRVQITLKADGEVVYNEETSLSSMRNYSRHYLLVHGKDSQVKLSFEDTGSNFFLARIRDKNLPFDAPCYHAFNALLIKDTDPKSWAPEQRKAIETYLQLGGTVVFTPVGAKDLGVREYWESIPGKTHEESRSLGRWGNADMLWKSVGLGRVYRIEKDLINDFLFQNAANKAQALSRMTSALSSPKKASFPRHYTRGNKESGNYSGLLLMIGFFVLYTLVLGPIVAIVHRRKPRMQLARSIVMVVIGFIVIAPAVAVLIRNGVGAVRIFSIIEFDQNRKAIQSSEVLLISGGGRSYSVEVKGLSDDLVGFVPSPDITWVEQNYYWTNYNRETLKPTSYKVQNSVNGTLKVDNLPIEAWDRYSFFTVEQPKTIEPLKVKVQWQQRDVYQITVTNNSPYTFHRLCFGVRTNSGKRFKPFSRKAYWSLPPNQSVTTTMNMAGAYRANFTDFMDFSAYNTKWKKYTQLPANYDFWLVGQLKQGGLAVTGSRIRVYADKTLWIQGTEVSGLPQRQTTNGRAFLGVRIESASSTNAWGQQGVVVIELTPGAPAEKAGVRLDDRILSVSSKGRSVQTNSPQALINALKQYKPGDTVRLEVFRGTNYNNFRNRTIKVKLGRRGRRR